MIKIKAFNSYFFNIMFPHIEYNLLGIHIIKGIHSSEALNRLQKQYEVYTN